MQTKNGLPDVVMGCLEACRRCEAVIEAVLTQNSAAFASVGPHLRHCIDHFGLLLEGWRSGTVNYDARPRDQALEHDPGAVRRALHGIGVALSALRSADLDNPLIVLQSAAPGRPPVAAPTRLDRELAFLSGHTIHHIAIMELAARAAGVAIPGDLAVAFSTESFRESLAMNR